MADQTLADTTAKPDAADAAVAASAEATAAAAKAAAEKTAANVAAAKPAFDEAAEVTRIAALPEAERAAAQKAFDDKKTAATVAASGGAHPIVLKAPEGSKVDAAFMERTTAIARELGLDQKGADRLLAERVNDRTAVEKAQQDAVEGLKPGGAIWEQRDTEYRTAALKDKDLGNGDQKVLDVAVEKVQQALTKFGDDELRADLKASGWGSKPSVLRLLARIGRAMGEGEQLRGGASGGKAELTESQRMFPKNYNPDGSPKL